MFDIAFSELVIIALVALVVIGPERLPRVARTVGHLLGRLQRYVSDVKSDIAREMQLEELKKMQSEVVQSTRDMEQSLKGQMAGIETELNQAIGAVPETSAATAEATEVALQTFAELPSAPIAEVETEPPQLELDLAPQVAPKKSV